MLNLIGSTVDLLNTIFKHYSDESMRFYSRRLIKIQTQLYDELAKGYNDQNDALIEKLTNEIKLITQVANKELESERTRQER